MQDWPDDFANIPKLRKRTRLPGLRMHLFTMRELLRSASEFAALLADPIFWRRNAGRGNGETVLVLLGYTCADLHTLALRNWLRRNGYRPVGSGLARMPAWSEETAEILCERAEALSRKIHDRITIIGHSMGGIFGWSIARRIPEVVRHVVVVGAPLASANGMLPESVAITSIYSINRPVEYPDSPGREPHARNFRVNGTHNGLAMNRHVYHILASVLHGA
jgi:pimeloyl-ACP methyl ester carboxylesterase